MRLFLLAALLSGPVFATDKPVPSAPSQSQSQNQHQAQSQSQGQYQSASASAQNGLSLNYKDRLQIPYTPPANAPSMPTNHSCALGDSSAWSIPVYAKSKGESKVDPQCEFRALVLVALAVDPCLARKLLATHPAIAIVQTGEVVCVPAGTSTVTKADLDRVKQESKARDDAVFRQSQKK